MTPFKGLSAFPVTPADRDGQVDCEHLSRIVEHLCRDGVSSVGIVGSTGGYMYLSASEHERAISAAVEAAEGVPVLAGVGAMATRDVLVHVRAAERAGALALLLAPVSYLPLTERDVAGLFADVAGASNLPICFYNNPGTTGFTPSEDLIAALAADGTIAAVKMPPAPNAEFSGQIARFRNTAPAAFSIGYSGDASIAGALAAGADGWYSVLAGTLPDIAIELWNARADPTKLSSLNERLAPLWATFDAYGGIRVVHEVMSMTGLGSASLPLPLLPLDQDARGQIEQALASAGLLENRAA